MALFEQWDRLGNDACARNARDANNRQLENYALYSALSNCRKPEEIMFNHPNLRSKIGYGPDRCAIDIDTQMTQGVERQRCRQQLYTRVFQGVPHLRPGNPDPAQEASIVQGAATSEMGCSGRREITEKQYNVFTPLIPSMQQTIQDPRNRVQPWTRGGDHTREYIHTDAFKKMCRA